MNRLVLALAVVLAVGPSLAGCDKPTPESCRKALLNMQHLLGNDAGTIDEAMIGAEIRRCRGGSSKVSVECATKATSLDELRKCSFYKVPELLPSAPAAGFAGSSAAGSAAAGNAAAGSAQ